MISGADGVGGVVGAVNHGHVVATGIHHVNLVGYRIHRQGNGIASRVDRCCNHVAGSVDHAHSIFAAVGDVDFVGHRVDSHG